MCKMFVIKSGERFVSEMSIGQWNKRSTSFRFMTYPIHHVGMRYYPTAEHATMIMDNLKAKLNLIGLDKNLEVVEVDMSEVSRQPFDNTDRVIVHIELPKPVKLVRCAYV